MGTLQPSCSLFLTGFPFVVPLICNWIITSFYNSLEGQLLSFELVSIPIDLLLILTHRLFKVLLVFLCVAQFFDRITLDFSSSSFLSVNYFPWNWIMFYQIALESNSSSFWVSITPLSGFASYGIKNDEKNIVLNAFNSFFVIPIFMF